MTRRAIALLIVAVCAPGAGIAEAGRTEAANRQAAVRDARALLARLNLPYSALPLAHEPSGDGGALSGPVLRPAASLLVDRHGWWRSPLSPSTVISYIRAHPPRGSRLTTTGASSGGRANSVWLGYEWPPREGVLGARGLIIDLVRLRGGATGVRADAEVVYIKPRPASERVPAGVHEIDITRGLPGKRPLLSLHVTNSARVRELIAMLDRLPIVQPGAWACPAILLYGPIVTFRFRTAQRGAVLATASEPSNVREPTTPCNPLRFSIGGKPQTPLLRGAAFLHAAQRLLGVRLAT